MVITGPGRKKIPVEVTDNDDGTFTCAYTPEEAGRHTYDIEFAGENVPESPFKVQVKPSADASKVVVDGLGPKEEVVAGVEHDFDIDAVNAGKGLYLMLKCLCTIDTNSAIFSCVENIWK